MVTTELKIKINNTIPQPNTKPYKPKPPILIKAKNTMENNHTPTPRFTPWNIESYNPIPSGDIKQEGNQLTTIIMRQLDRIGHNVSMGLARVDGTNQIFEIRILAKSVRISLGYIEALLDPIITEDDNYKQTTREIKHQIKNMDFNTTNEWEYFTLLFKWQAAIMQQLAELNIVPSRTKNIQFD